MKRSTVALFALLLGCIIAALVYFQQHQVQLMSVHLGAMSRKTKEHFWKHGIDCQETYEIQGYESPESLFKMFSLTQQQLMHLNPGFSLSVHNRGEVLCIKGVWDISTHAMTWFWPGLLAGLAAVASAVALVLKAIQKPQAHAHGHGHGHGHSAAGQPLSSGSHGGAQSV